MSLIKQGAAEPMQVDAALEENENVEEEHHMVEQTNLVGIVWYYTLYVKFTNIMPFIHVNCLLWNLPVLLDLFDRIPLLFS